ncbi:hypothetical protein Tco_0944942 [Tanacetum coccineum]
MIEPVPKPARRRPSGISFRDTSSVSKKMSYDPSQNIKGNQTLALGEQIDADMIKALKESKKTSRRQPGTGGSSEGTSVSPGVPNKSTVIPATSSEGTGTKPGDDDETIEWVDTNEEEEKKDDDDEKSIDLEQIDDEETNDEFTQVNDDEDEEITHAKLKESENGDAETTDAVKVDAGKTKEAKDDAKKVKLPPTSSSLSVSSGFGDQFLKLSSYTSLVSMVKDTTNIEINSLLDIKIQSEVLHIQSPPVLTVPILVIYEPLVLTPIPETPSVALATTFLPPLSISTIPPVLLQTTTPMPAPLIITEAPTTTTAVPKSDALTDVHLRVAKLEKDVSELKKIDYSTEAPITLKSQVPMVVEHYLGSKIGDDTQKVLQKHTANLIQKYSVKPSPNPSTILTSTIDLEPESEKSALEIHKIKKEQAEKQNMPKYTIKSTNKTALKEYCKILEIITQ